MQVFHLEFSSTMFHVGVHQEDTSEEGLFSHFVGRKDFNHPVNHFWSEGGSDAMGA